MKPIVHGKNPEYIRWIAKNGRVLGRVDKYFAHVNGLLHDVVHVFVVDARGRLIIQFRSRTKKIYPSLWDTSVGGHAGWDETLEEGVARETMEELGIRVTPHYLGKLDFSGNENGYHHAERIHFYCAQMKKGTRIRPNEEFDDIAHIPLRDVDNFIRTHACAPGFKGGWKKFGKKIQQKIHVRGKNSVAPPKSKSKLKMKVRGKKKRMKRVR